MLCSVVAETWLGVACIESGVPTEGSEESGSIFGTYLLGLTRQGGGSGRPGISRVVCTGGWDCTDRMDLSNTGRVIFKRLRRRGHGRSAAPERV